MFRLLPDRDFSLLQSLVGSVVTRLAPSPTGHLHEGHILHLIYVRAFAVYSNAKVLLRFEDHDRQRCKKEYTQAILNDLKWLGWQFSSPLFQSERRERYEELLRHLLNQGRAYVCTCTRKELQPYQRAKQLELFYPGLCREKKLPFTKGVGVRLRLPDETVVFHDLLKGKQKQNPAKQCGDLLLYDREGNFTYNFAVAVDDNDQGINMIVRGEDVLPCTGRQEVLAKTLGREKSPLYCHHPLLYDTEGKKLSKRHFAQSLAGKRSQGISAEEIIGNVLWKAGLGEEHQRISLDAITLC